MFVCVKFGGMEQFEMEEFMVDEFVLDFDYEFDAPQYFDFSQPETFEETTETERWFKSAASYHPSCKHYIIELLFFHYLYVD